ncbi:hypothetical protein D3C76_852470 [compost metagenome]
MALAGVGQFSALFEFFQGITAGGVEQAVEHLFVTDVHDQQRLGHQLRDRAKHLARFDVFAHDHRRGRFQGKATAQDAQAPQAGLFAGSEQVEAPVQRRAQGLMPALGRLAAVGEQAKTFLQLRQQTAEAKVGDLRGREFQGQRNAVQALADLDDQRQFGFAQLKAVLVGHGPLDKQL